jgi:hypothetical protein
VMSLRKVTRKRQKRGKAIREYRRKKQGRRGGGGEGNRKIEIPSARREARHISRGYGISAFIKRIAFRELFRPVRAIDRVARRLSYLSVR